MKTMTVCIVLALAAGSAWAKLPPLGDEAKAKAAEAAAKTGHGNKVADFQLCKSMERVAVGYRDASKKAGKEVKPATETPACADPGPFVYTPPTAASAPAPAVATAAAAPAAPANPATPPAAAPAKK